MLLLLSFAASTLALPLQNTNNTNATLSSQRKVGWSEAPQIRGTFDLLLSCLTTLSLCAWTAYHPNVNVARSDWSRWAHRVVWMIIAILVPEAVLWCAWEQWWAARQLRKKVNEMIEKKNSEKAAKDTESQHVIGMGEEDESVCGICKRHRAQTEPMSEQQQSSDPENTNLPLAPPSTSRISTKPLEAWTTEHSFFAISGGFALPSPIPSYPPRTLTPTGILLLIELDLLPNIPPTTITDKSKADAIAKALVCIQAGWFSIQCVARAAKKLPITVLEIHVLAHVLCAFAIYAIWFKKGYDVGSPILVEGERAEDLGALFALDAGALRRASQIKEGTTTSTRCISSTLPLTPPEVSPSHHYSIRPSSTLKYCSKLSTYFELQSLLSATRTRSLKLPPPCIETPELTAHLQRANSALNFLKKHGVHAQFSVRLLVGEHGAEEEADGEGREVVGDVEEVKGSETEGTCTGIYFAKRYTVPTRSDLSVEGLDEATEESRNGDVVFGRQTNTYVLFSTLYGALHLIPLLSQANFPTRIEHTLWLAFTVCMLVMPISFTIAVTSIRLLNPLRPPSSPPSSSSSFSSTSSASASTSASTSDADNTDSPIVLGLKSLARFFLSVNWFLFSFIGVVASAGYPFARVYVLGECFAGLRSVDSRVYETVDWVAFWPHAG